MCVASCGVLPAVTAAVYGAAGCGTLLALFKVSDGCWATSDGQSGLSQLSEDGVDG